MERVRAMKTKIVRIGNSLGVCIPKLLIEKAGLEDEVQLRIVESGLLIEGTSRPRAGWDKAAEKLRARGEDGLLDEPYLSDFDESEWEWE
jgi:antitoxin MazE